MSGSDNRAGEGEEGAASVEGRVVGGTGMTSEHTGDDGATRKDLNGSASCGVSMCSSVLFTALSLIGFVCLRPITAKSNKEARSSSGGVDGIRAVDIAAANARAQAASDG